MAAAILTRQAKWRAVRLAVELAGSRLAPPARALLSLISSRAGCPVQAVLISAPPATALAISLQQPHHQSDTVSAGLTNSR